MECEDIPCGTTCDNTSHRHTRTVRERPVEIGQTIVNGREKVCVSAAKGMFLFISVRGLSGHVDAVRFHELYHNETKRCLSVVELTQILV